MYFLQHVPWRRSDQGFPTLQAFNQGSEETDWLFIRVYRGPSAIAPLFISFRSASVWLQDGEGHRSKVPNQFLGFLQFQSGKQAQTLGSFAFSNWRLKRQWCDLFGFETPTSNHALLCRGKSRCSKRWEARVSWSRMLHSIILHYIMIIIIFMIMIMWYGILYYERAALSCIKQPHAWGSRQDPGGQCGRGDLLGPDPLRASPGDGPAPSPRNVRVYGQSRY